MSLKPKYPEYGTDATGANTYATLVSATSLPAGSIYAYCATNPAIVSFDNGTTDHLYVPAGQSVQVNGVSIPTGATIRAKNATADSNYASLVVNIW